MLIVSLPNSPVLLCPVTVMTFVPLLKETDACQQGSGSGTGKKPHDPKVAEPLPPAELLQLTLLTRLLRVPLTVAVALDVENPALGSVIWIKSATSCRSGASSPSAPQPASINAAQHRTLVRAFIAISLLCGNAFSRNHFSSLGSSRFVRGVIFLRTYTSANASTRVRMH